MHILIIFIGLAFSLVGKAEDSVGVEAGFPVRWDGDKFKNFTCATSGVPIWIDGYFFMQASASFGDQNSAEGEHLIHLFDGISAVASFSLNQNQVQFSASYYPTLWYKIWDLYDRNMTKSKVAWFTMFSPFNIEAYEQAKKIDQGMHVEYNPNVDFWLVGNQMIAATEMPYTIGLTFDAASLDNFGIFPFKDDPQLTSFLGGQKDVMPLNLPVHERIDSKSKLIWSTFSAIDMSKNQFSQVIFSVTSAGERRVEGVYQFDPFDPTKCSANGTFQGEMRSVPGYMHGITSSVNYVILPMTSTVYADPCELGKPPPRIEKNGIRYVEEKFPNWNRPIRFLLFNKNTKKFEQPIDADMPGWISHQFNAYEKDSNTIVADMLVYDNTDGYNKYPMIEYLTHQPYPKATKALRFTIDIAARKIRSENLMPSVTNSIEFSQFNHKLEELPYKFGYVVQYPYSRGSTVLKINVDDHSGQGNLEFIPGPNVTLGEPWFVPSPNSQQEDEGVLLVKGNDLMQKRGLLFVIDATTMKSVGTACAPDVIPHGLHNRFYERSIFNQNRPQF